MKCQNVKIIGWLAQHQVLSLYIVADASFVGSATKSVDALFAILGTWNFYPLKKFRLGIWSCG